MLFLHEVHKVIGSKEDEFEAAYRDEWMATMAKSDDVRLLWYANHAHGSGMSYQVVTITALADGRAWEDLAHRARAGDLQAWMREVDTLRHDVEGKILIPLPWSPMQEIDLANVPVDRRDHELSMYMEDTMWPYDGKLQAYIDACGSVYSKSLKVEASERLISIELALQPALGSSVRNEVTLMQKVHDAGRLQHLLMSEIPPEMRKPGTWMHEALGVRDQWESKLLRTSAWSPLY
jgi:hypothetical protein